MHTMTTPELVERFRVRCTSRRRLEALHAPPSLLEGEARRIERYRAELRRRGLCAARIDALGHADLDAADVVGRPLARAVGAAVDAALDGDRERLAEAAARLRALGVTEDAIADLTGTDDCG